MRRIDSDDIAHFSTAIGFAILLITTFVICLFEISLIVILFLIYLIYIYIYVEYISDVIESKGTRECISRGHHTWIEAGRHQVVEPWSDKQNMTYWVTDFKCSVCGMKKEE